MEISEIVESGILIQGEHITEATDGTLKIDKGYANGTYLVTNKRLLFMQKRGFFSKGYNVVFSVGFDDIGSISTKGFFSKMILLTVSNMNDKKGLFIYELGCKNFDSFTRLLIDSKSKYSPEPKKVIIDNLKIEAKMEDNNKVDDNPLKVLKLRYAKGEITKEVYEQMKKDLED